MSQPQEQPKILLHKPKKSQRSPGANTAASAAAQPTSLPLPKSSSPGEKAAGFRGVSTSSGNQPPAGGGTQQPLWYRFRTAITTILILNGLVLGYTLFRTKSGPQTSEVQAVEETISVPEEDSKLKEAEEKESVPTQIASHEPSLPFPAVSSEKPKHPEISREQQRELYEWMLAERRKMKPANTTEKAKIDQEKLLLKQYIRGNKNLAS